MSVYDEMYDCIESARSTDACEYHVYSEMFDLIAEAEAESEKLRQLVRDMWRDVPKTESCGWDNSANTCTGSDECHGECALWYHMRDLGIEVDNESR